MSELDKLLSEFELQDRRATYLGTVREMIGTHGFMLQGVFPTPESPGPEFQYTVGLTEHGHRELIIMGLSQRLAGDLLTGLALRVLGGETIAPGTELERVIVGFSVYTLATVTTEQFGTARALYGDQVSGLQIVWPDGKGRLPWQEGHDLTPGLQPLLGQP